MTGYAPNPTSSDNAAASLTPGLLARKGQATPAVDAIAHEGVNVDLDTNFASRPKPRSAGAQAVATNFPESRAVVPSSEAYAQPAAEESRWNGSERPNAPPITLDAAPENWTITSDGAPLRPSLRKRSLRDGVSAQLRLKESGLRANVKFRMPATDFIRLRAASRAMKESCQVIIVDAIAAYLDANEVDPVDEETARREAARLSRNRQPG